MMKPDNSGQYTIRKFDSSDMEAFSQIRLEALLLEPAVFSSNYNREAAFPAEEWLKRLRNPEAAFFGLYRKEELVGITGIIAQEPGSRIALLIASYIRKAHRGNGLSTLLYQARIGWARTKGFTGIVVSHRKGNDPSRAANQYSGFRYTHSEMMLWPDGAREENIFYRLELS